MKIFKRAAGLILLITASVCHAQPEMQMNVFIWNRSFGSTDTLRANFQITSPQDESMTVMGGVTDAAKRLRPSADWQVVLERMGKDGPVSSRTLVTEIDPTPRPLTIPPHRSHAWQWATSVSQVAADEGFYRIGLAYKDQWAKSKSFYVGPTSIPDWIRIDYAPYKETHLLGEPIMLRVNVRNDGDMPWPIESGGDYRGAARHQRFAFRGEHLNGGLAPIDPHPYQQNMGGMGPADGELQPGKTFEENLDLRPYLFFSEPGRYRIRAFQDLGFGSPVKGLASSGHFNYAAGDEFEIELAAPSEPEMRSILDRALAKTDHADRTYALAELRHPAYLEPLKTLLTGAPADPSLQQALIVGIASIETPAATRELIELTADPRQPVRQMAYSMLFGRLPDPWLVGAKADWARDKTPETDPYERWDARAKVLAAWDESLREPAVEATRRGMQAEASAERVAAIQCASSLADARLLPDLIQAANRAFATTGTAENRMAMQEMSALTGAARRLSMLGSTITTPTLAAPVGEKVLWAAANGWSMSGADALGQALLLDMVRSPDPRLRRNGIQYMPNEFQRKNDIPWKSLLADKDQSLRFYAGQKLLALKPAGWRAIVEDAIELAAEEDTKRELRDLLRQ